MLSSGLMSKRAVTRIALVLALLVALLAALPALAQPLRTSAVLEGGGAGVLYGLGAEQELARAPGLGLHARVSASAFPVLFARGTLWTLSGQLAAVIQPGGDRFGVEPSVGVTALGARRFGFLVSAPVDTLVLVRTVGLAVRVNPGSGQRLGGRAGVTALLYRDRWGAVLLPMLGATWMLSSPHSRQLDARAGSPPASQ